MGQYKKVFKEEKIDGMSLVHLSEDHLKEMKIEPIGVRIKMLQQILTLSNGFSNDSPIDSPIEQRRMAAERDKNFLRQQRREISSVRAKESSDGQEEEEELVETDS